MDLDLLQVFLILQGLTNNNYLVGGCVRDLLLKKTPKDYDIVTDAHYNSLIEIFTDSGWYVQTVGSHFLVCVVYKNGKHYEISNFRKDGFYLDGRRPLSVEAGTIDDDAFRRDFTINALYLNPFSNVIIDPTKSGLNDLKTKTLRFIGRAEDRLKEDNLRAFRFYRFIAKGFKPHKPHLKVVRTMFNDCCKNTNPERVREEMEKIVNL